MWLKSGTRRHVQEQALQSASRVFERGTIALVLDAVWGGGETDTIPRISAARQREEGRRRPVGVLLVSLSHGQNAHLSAHKPETVEVFILQAYLCAEHPPGPERAGQQEAPLMGRRSVMMCQLPFPWVTTPLLLKTNPNPAGMQRIEVPGEGPSSPACSLLSPPPISPSV